MKTMSRHPIRIFSVLLLGCCLAGLVRAGNLNLTLERSTDLQDWEKVTLDASMITAEGTLQVDAELPAFYRMDIQPVEKAPEGMVLVVGGTLATSNELNGTVVSTFYIGKYEVTWDEWLDVRSWAATHGYDIDSVGAGCANDHPVRAVSWYDVVKWCNARSEKEELTPVYTVGGAIYRTGQTVPEQNLSTTGYRLPLEAEWEFAARGGNQTNGYTYSGGNDLDAVGWYYDNSEGAACLIWDDRGTWPVGQKAANELGLHDMSGNVWEWCWDAYDGVINFLRGGSWDYSAGGCTVSHRWATNPAVRSDFHGFRLARNAVP